jgi:hypothetical protein
MRIKVDNFNLTHIVDGKMRQVKCRIDLIMSDLDPQSCVVQFTQQQGKLRKKILCK